MARVTVEDCLEKVTTASRWSSWAPSARASSPTAAVPLVACSNKPAVTSLREIAKGQVRFNESVEGTVRQYLDEVKARGNRPEKSAGAANVPPASAPTPGSDSRRAQARGSRARP